MKSSTTVTWLSTLILLLALVVAGVGLFWKDGGSPFSFTTLRGQAVQMYGQGIYRYDTVFAAGTFIGTDAVTLFVAIPLLIAALLLSRQRSLRGRLLLLSLLAYFTYYGASLAFGVAYNNLFLAYIALFSASLFAFVLQFTTLDLPSLPARVSPRLPHRGLAVFMVVSGVVLLLVWLSDLAGGMFQGQAPATLASYTTIVTYVLDLGIIVPALLVTGRLLLRRAPLGYPLAFILLVNCALIGLVVIAQTIAQKGLGIDLTPAQMAVFIGSFLVMSLFAVGFLVRLWRHTSDRAALA